MGLGVYIQDFCDHADFSYLEYWRWSLFLSCGEYDIVAYCPLK